MNNLYMITYKILTDIISRNFNKLFEKKSVKILGERKTDIEIIMVTIFLI